MTDELVCELIKAIHSLTATIQQLTRVTETRSVGPSSHEIAHGIRESKYGSGPDTL